jgi:DNA-binding transcriptional ArsR family regulator
MAEFDPAPETDEEPRWHGDRDTFDRVYDAVLGVTSPTAYTDIAELADCAPNTAKKHLERLTEMGIVRADRESRPARYERNEGYLEWQEATHIANERSAEEIRERVATLEAQREEYEARFEHSDPGAVSVFDRDDHEAVHERMEAISDWQGIIRDIRLYELAHQLARNDGHLLPA